MHIALFQPDIPGNTGTILRLAACLESVVHIIEPAGFDLSDKALKRAGMDYLEKAALRRHLNWNMFEEWRGTEERRLVLFTTKSATPYVSFDFRPRDILLFGSESSGAPDFVHQAADMRLTIPMIPEARSLNLALSVAMVAGEFRRQNPLAPCGRFLADRE
ncbi:tRNA (cytidine(34)-2'-O)-methyltransferase [Oricola cellulosilytica]|uniref:tRNA (cytidine(34)-2'-O)-methyltransferase n=1 Tax=Oricola cellulosilytica TaxID=1429082 RepID=A0A4R0PCY9_9HYPH|nr:tRNA (cytidine(34)-2'-O)-methyltransferase [Oricola cellulosilytica]TCD15341.1 tRNA (cytidine(34)-2'-O)-methyltransferase [Oricola cellulosilytica]